MIASHQVSPGVRQRLTAPRGHRFSRPGSNRPPAVPPETHEQRRERLLRQVQGNPRVAHMLQHGPTPYWFEVARQRQEKEEREAQALETAVAEAEAFLAAQTAPAPPRGRHRAPRRWWAWPAAALGSALLFGLTVTEALAEGFAQNVGFLP
ncbi:hypothetical protein NE857_29725 [Nocardiopsis exhalans]|uniref:Uncharacterized protein n=1 Tax=Nocardiopsis exhalans TaxID=163604 RepID=A0ABY5D4S4_9ACTN|nr:hypothetical protein [Nocardiopsis exhalans]USY19381.1 hypothetical protein NE857_29725 [Nocardiopsis exhalans]